MKINTVLTTVAALAASFATAQAATRSVSLEFPGSGNATVRGTLLLPANASAGKKLPVVVISGPWTQIRGMSVDLYAAEFAERGFAALTFDPAGMGQSDGTPREAELPSRRAADLRAAVAHAAGRPEIDASRVHVFGYCASGGYAVLAAAGNPQVRSLTLAAGWFTDAANIRDWFGPATDTLLADGAAARERLERTGQVTYRFAAHPTEPAAMGGFPYYIDPQWARIGYANLWAVHAYEEIVRSDNITPAARLTQPTLVIHSDEAIFPAGARKLYATLPDGLRKELAWSPARTQLAYYEDTALIDTTTAQAADWFKATL
jgi:uncharacterized protein